VSLIPFQASDPEQFAQKVYLELQFAEMVSITLAKRREARPYLQPYLMTLQLGKAASSSATA